MISRPRIQIPLNNTDRFLEFSGWAFLAVTWGYLIFNYGALPETIPTHFNASGHADGFGSKISIILLPVIATVFYAGLTFLNRFPHVFNYPRAVTPQNAGVLYRRATLIIRYLKLGLVLLFGIVTYKSIGVSLGREKGLGVWLLPVILISSFSFVLYTIVTLSKKVPSEKE